MRALVPVLMSLLLGACNSLPLLGDKPAPTLADLPLAELPQQQAPPPSVSLQQLSDIYREVLAPAHAQASLDPDTRLQVQHRLADIQLLAGEAVLAEGDDVHGGAAFAPAISAYSDLLQAHPDNPRNDHVLYQLSRAYELSGDNAGSLAVLGKLSREYPESGYYLEAQFRQAESDFIATDYAAAERAYGEVIAGGVNTPYYLKSLYMQGWARFKQDAFRQSIAPFTATLDQLLQDDNSLDGLPRGEAELAGDCLRVLALVFSYLEGADTIASTSASPTNTLGSRSYQHLLYQQLGDLYLQQERFRDSAETYRAYTRLFPDSQVAHQMQLRVIASYQSGGFADLIVEEKRQYVELFSVGQPYWQQTDEAAREAIALQLKLFIAELAGHYHALAQGGGEAPAPAEATDTKTQQVSDEAASNYLLAGDYYQLYIDSFPEDPQVPALGFLLAESRMDAGRYREAIDHYEWVAYQFSDSPRAADAAYAAVVAYDKLEPATAERTAGEELQRQRIASERRFAMQFSADERAPLVLSHAASGQLALGDYPGAIASATGLLQWQPTPAGDVRTAALLVLGHGSFELAKYRDAELAYTDVRVLLPETDSRLPVVMDNLAASIYRQAEEAVIGENFLQAADQFARVSAVAPNTNISISAHFDAASNYLRGGDLAQGNRLLIEFRERYPQHALSATVAATLVANYEQLQQWDAAAAELDRVEASSPDPEQQRQALYLAAQYYDRAGDTAHALQRYQTYTRQWPQPVAPRIEAMYRSAELFQSSGQVAEQQQMLEQLIVVQGEAGSAVTERTLYLAAAAASTLAEQAYTDFDAIALRIPLKQSLQRKKVAMQAAISASQRAASFGVQAFSTRASYRMGLIYQQLSSDLLASERPAGIDALALEQYELLLEEQAFPFEEKAIAIFETNVRRSWEGIYDQWVQLSFDALAALLPARYLKPESGPRFDSRRSAALGGDLAQAQQWFEQALEASADNAGNLDLYNQYGIFLRQQGRFDAAEQVYLDALTVREDDADIHRNLGILYDLYRGERNRALQHFYRYQALSDEDQRMVSGWIADLERQPTLLVQGGLGDD